MLDGDEKYNPEPDVTVIDTTVALGQIYVGRFYFVAEVLSESDKNAVVEAKLRYYQDHRHNRCVLFVRQDRVEAEQHDREGAGWRPRQLSGAHEPLTLPDIGAVGCLGDLYKFTPARSIRPRRNGTIAPHSAMGPALKGRMPSAYLLYCTNGSLAATRS